MTEDIRWKQRFQNYSKAYHLLKEAMEKEPSTLSQLEKEGIIQRFEYTFALAWKVLKDKMAADGLTLDQISPKAIARQAFATKYIDDAEGWLRMIGDRNLMSHTYNLGKFEAIIENIRQEHLALLERLHNDLQAEYSDDSRPGH